MTREEIEQRIKTLKEQRQQLFGEAQRQLGIVDGRIAELEDLMATCGDVDAAGNGRISEAENAAQ